MQFRRCERGQAIVEYIGVVLVVAVLLLALSTLDIRTGALDALAGSVCAVAGLDACRSDGTESQRARRSVDPRLTPGQRAALLGDPRAAQVTLSSLTAAERVWLERNDRAAAAGAARAESWGERRRLVDRYAGGDLAPFLRYRGSSGRDPRLDYSTDHCSAPVLGSRGLAYDFAEACVRHDFAYRNYKALEVFPGMRSAVDSVFLRDMLAHCATRSPLPRAVCRQRALQYYAGVRALGGRTRKLLR